MVKKQPRHRSAWTLAVASQVRAERGARGLTQRDVIEASGVPRSTYILLETGQRVADVDQLGRIAAAFGMPTSVLFRRAEERMSDTPDLPAELEDRLDRMPPDMAAEIRAGVTSERKPPSAKRSGNP